MVKPSRVKTPPKNLFFTYFLANISLVLHAKLNQLGHARINYFIMKYLKYLEDVVLSTPVIFIVFVVDAYVSSVIKQFKYFMCYCQLRELIVIGYRERPCHI